MLRVLPVLIELGLLIYCLIDCVQTPEQRQRNLPKWAWIVLILFFPFVGGIAWLVAGRPAPDSYRGNPSGADRVSGYPEYQRGLQRSSAPDDDPIFLRQLGRVDSEHEQTLEKWEADLRRREAELQQRGEEPSPEPPTA